MERLGRGVDWKVAGRVRITGKLWILVEVIKEMKYVQLL